GVLNGDAVALVAVRALLGAGRGGKIGLGGHRLTLGLGDCGGGGKQEGGKQAAHRRSSLDRGTGLARALEWAYLAGITPIGKDPPIGKTPMSTYEARLAALRAQLKADRLDGFVVPLTDEHMSEYVGSYAQR